jgi:hypothetical protein
MVHVYQLIAENTVEAKVCIAVVLVCRGNHEPSLGSRHTGEEKEAD